MQPKARHKARKLALQGIYEWQLNQNEFLEVKAHLIQTKNMAQLDQAYFEDLLSGVIKEVAKIDEHIQSASEIKLNQLDLVELAVLRLAVFEFMQRQDVPYKVVINEAVELTKTFGAEAGYRFVNGVLDKLAPILRKMEFTV